LVLHATDRYAIVSKPAGMLSVPGKGPDKADCAAARVAAMFPRASGPLVVHRLDMETSGLLVFGLDAAAQRELSMQFEDRTPGKSYIALLPRWARDGEELPERGEVSLPVRADLKNRPVQIVDLEHGRPSLTRWRVLAREIDRVRIAFEPLTGRTHQLRVHAAAGLSRPILGDTLYGGEPAERLMLHAAALSFVEPGTSRRVRFMSPTPF
jgi:tRNA pseudouridine32 synthase/23S rRNA pseudouridine746 synthase